MRSRTLTWIVAAILLGCATSVAGLITNNGDGTSTLSYRHDTATIELFDQALADYGDAIGSFDGAGPLLILVLREHAVVVDVGGGKSTWSITVSNALGNAFIAEWAPRVDPPFVDVDPADGLDDTTGLTDVQTVDAAVKKMFVSRITWKQLRDRVPITPPTDPVDP